MDETTESTPESRKALADSIATPVVVSDHGSLEARKAFNAALAAAQGEFAPIVKNREVTIKPRDSAAYSFRYADLQEIQAKTRPALSANGLSTTSQMIPGDDGASIVVILMHAQGFERVSEAYVKYGEEIKQFGAKVKYMRRYMVQGLLDVDADDDLDENGDDGGVGGAAPVARAPAPRATPARKAPAASAPRASAEPPPDDNPPPDETELQQRAAARTTGAAVARERVIAGTPGVDENKVAEQTASINQQIAARQEPPLRGATQQADDDGELAEVGEINFLLKRCKTRGGDMAAVLAELGLTLDPATLQGLTKTQWGLIKSKV